jgi:ankyrin repeat protein
MIKAITGGDLIEITKLHRDGVDIDGIYKVKSYHHTPLSYACDLGETDTAKYLIQLGANVNGSQTYDYTHDELYRIPILVTVDNDDEEMLRYLLDHDADPDMRIQGIFSEHVLFRAIVLERTKMIELLLQHGANPNTVNSRRWSPLTLAVSYNYIEMAKILILHGSNIDFQNFNGMTALGIANSNTDITMLLLLEGANVNTKGYFVRDEDEHPLVIRCRYAIPLLYNGMHRDMVDLFLKFII